MRKPRWTEERAALIVDTLLRDPDNPNWGDFFEQIKEALWHLSSFNYGNRRLFIVALTTGMKGVRLQK